MDEDGYFYLVDRAREMFISGGENVYPAEVERVLREHPAIEEAAVIGIPDASWGEVGVAFVIPCAGYELSEEEVVSHCRERLAAYKVPTRVIFRREFPRTPLGKIRKFLLKPLIDQSEQQIGE